MNPELHELIRGRSLAPGGEPVFIFGGELHYFRIPRPLWRDRLRKARAAFLNTAGVYIPWNLHEPSEGGFVFQDDLDLREWLECIRETGMYLFARPGPYICAEWDGGGLPGWFLGKDRLVRTGDPEYLEAVSRWFRAVNGILRDWLPENGGNLLLYQVENELTWDEPEYFRRMAAWVRREGITAPLITNLNPGMRPSPDIADSLDLYPGPWNLHKPEVSIASLLEEQPRKLAACVELQMGFAVEVGSTLPTMVGPIDAAWVEVHTKNNIARGLNILNYYMFAGGTTFGYHTGRRDITSYDYDSGIREWGELGAKYYAARRIGAFLDSFGKDMARTVPAADIPVDAPRGVSVLRRRGEDSEFVFPRNLTRSAQRLSFRLELPDGEEIPFPLWTQLHLAPQSMKMLPVNVSLGGGVTLVYSSTEVFGVYRFEDEAILVISGEPGEHGEILLRGVPGVDHVRGDAAISEECGGMLVSFLHRAGAHHILLLSPEADDFSPSLRGIRIVAADRHVAERTWIVETERGRLPVLSGEYFSDGGALDGGTLRLPLSRRPGGPGFVEFPALPNVVAPPTAFLDGVEVAVDADRHLRTVRVSLPPSDAPEAVFPLSPWRRRAEEPLSLNGEPGWKPYRAFLGNERSGEWEGGYYAYRCRFVHDGSPEGVRLIFAELHDNADIWLNGEYLGGGSARNNNGLRLDLDATPALRRGENELFALVENEGRPRKGDDATFTGITGPVALTVGEERVSLRNWKRGYLAAETEASMGAVPAETLPGFDDRDWERVEVRPGWDSRLIVPPTSTHIELGHERVYAVYRTTFALSAGADGRGVILDAGKCDGKCWVYLNGVRVDKKHQETFAADLTPHLREGENTLTLVIRNFRWYTTLGLHGEIGLRIVDRVLAEGWEFIRGLPGQREHLPGGDAAGWTVCDGGTASARTWLAAEFPYRPTPGWTMPLGLRLEGWNAKTLIYLNGFLVGRYHPEGPQEVFYLPEDRLRDRNSLVLFCNSHDAPLRTGVAEVRPYCVIRESVLEVRL